jgi:hypothetical protein
LLSSISTVLGVIIGAILTYILTRSHEQQKHYRSVRTAAYADYLLGIADAAHLDLNSNQREIDARVSDAEARICLYGSPKVIRLLGEFKLKGNATISEEQCAAFIEIIQAMRDDDSVDGATLHTILIGPKKRDS